MVVHRQQVKDMLLMFGSQMPAYSITEENSQHT